MKVEAEPVAEIHHGVHAARRARPCPRARRGHGRRCASTSSSLSGRALASAPQSRRRPPEGAGDEELVAGLGPAAQHRAAPGTLAKDRDRDRSRRVPRERSPPTTGIPVSAAASATPRCSASRSVPGGAVTATTSAARSRAHRREIRERGCHRFVAEVLAGETAPHPDERLRLRRRC